MRAKERVKGGGPRERGEKVMQSEKKIINVFIHEWSF